MNENIIEFKDLSKTFPGVKALSDVSFSIRKGEVHALLGENGAGKSTLIKVLSGVYTPDLGTTIIINGEEFSELTTLQAVRKGIAVTYQDFSLFPNLTVAENIAIGERIESGNKRVGWKQVRKIAKNAIERIGIDLDLDATLGEFSTAKQQLVAIARALNRDAKIIVLDEPTSSLSETEVKHLFRIINDLKDKGIAVLFVSHKMDEVFQISDRMTIMRDGQYMGTYNKEDIDVQKVISIMVGREVFFNRVKNDHITKTPLLEVRKLTKKGNYHDINFTLHEGEILGITGLVGAGRTEVCETIFGCTQPDSGEIIINGQKKTIKNTEEAVNLGIAFVPEDRQIKGIVLGNTAQDNIALNTMDRLINKFSIIDNHKKRSSATQWMEKLDVRPAYPDMIAGNFSGGNQQKIIIAKWIASNPKILIIDEPTNGVDIGAKDSIHTILRELTQKGIGIIMISSELPEVLALSDRILIMRRGRLVGEIDGDMADQEMIMSKALL